MSWTIEQNSRNVSTVRIRYKGLLDQDFLLTSDRHWDNPKSDQKMQQEHLEEADERDAGVIDCGDLFCAMQGKFDKRSDKDDIRTEHVKGDYLDALVRTADKFFAPWWHRYITFGMGNHETKVLERHETNLTNRLVEKMRERGSSVYNGGYSGWVRFIIEKDNGGRHYEQQSIVKLHYDHGYGGGGPVTRDVIQTNRRAVYLPDADIVMSGHTHDMWNVPIARHRLTDDGAIMRDEQLHIKLPTYKDEYGDGFDGFHIEKGRPPKPLGAYWLHFFNSRRSGKSLFEVKRVHN